MNLDFAVDRLYEVGWSPSDDADLVRLADGRRMPSISCVKREFGRAGLDLSIEHAPKFRCYRASWGPVSSVANPTSDEVVQRGTVVGTCEQEAVVYALAQLLIAQQGGAVAV